MRLRIDKHGWAIGRAVAVGLLGGGIAHLLNMPLAWMLGPLWATITLSYWQTVAAPPAYIRRLALAVVGCYLGASFTPNFAEQLHSVPAALPLTFLLTFICTISGAFILKYFLRADNHTSFLSSTPGGLSLAMAAAEAGNSDKHVIIICQVLRVMIFASILPLLARFLYDDTVPTLTIDALTHTPSARETGWLVAVFVVIVFVGRIINSAMAYLLGAVISFGLLFAGNVVSAHLPWIILAVAQLVIGVSAGARLRIEELKRSGRTTIIAIVIALLYIVIGMIFAAIVAPFGGPPFLVWLLAFTPGGITEICLVAQLLDLQPIFVLTMQVARLFFIASTTPIIMRILQRYGA